MSRRVTATPDRGVYLVRSDTSGTPPWRVEVSADGQRAKCGCEIEHKRTEGVDCKHCRWAIDAHLEILRQEQSEFLDRLWEANITRKLAINRTLRTIQL